MSLSQCVFVCLFRGFTPYLRPIFTQQPQGEITSYSPTQLCFLSVSTTTGGMSHHVYPPARKTERARGRRSSGGRWRRYTKECVCKTHTVTHFCMWNNHAGMHEALQTAKTHRVTGTGVTDIRACSHYQEHCQHATEG